MLNPEHNPNLYLCHGADHYRVERPSGHSVKRFATKEDAHSALVALGYAHVKAMNANSDWYSILIRGVCPVCGDGQCETKSLACGS